MGWHGGGNCHPWAMGCHPFATPKKFPSIFYGCFIIVAKGRSPKILADINLFLHTLYAFYCDNIQYEISS